MDFSQLVSGDKIEYVGDTYAFGGEYSIVAAESTYSKEDFCPENERGKLMIVEFMNDGTPMFFTVDTLDKEEWIKI